jgi:hypothetical protein
MIDRLVRAGRGLWLWSEPSALEALAALRVNWVFSATPMDESVALVVFRSRAAGEIFYFLDDAHRLIEVAGKQPSPRGIFTTDQLAEAIARLEAAVADENAKSKPGPSEDGEEAESTSQRRVALAQRAFPLLEMLRAAQKKKVDVTWGV